jgi:hypothetical protein
MDLILGAVFFVVAIYFVATK